MSHDRHCERGQRLIKPGRRQSYEPYVRDNHRCHCRKRARESAGLTHPPQLDFGTRCSHCGQHPKRNRNSDLEASWICRTCHVAWDSRGYGWWLDDHGYLGEPVTTPQLVGDQL